MVDCEFAHKLDMLNGDADGVPPLPADIPRREWESALFAAYDDFCDRVDAAEAAPGGTYCGEFDDDAPAIDPYASENPGEFFAVLSETFFEAPHVLHHEHPALYALFSRFYRQDPIGRKGA